MMIIGVKSNIPKRVGIYFLTKVYIGARISERNFGLNRIPSSVSQERIISIITMYSIISKKITKANKIVVIVYMLWISCLYAFSAAFSWDFFLLLPLPSPILFFPKNTHTRKDLLWSGPSSSSTS